MQTGHSLGGALATLAAYDIRKQLQASGKQDVEVLCYSFGAPRTGNHAFATDYNCVVPDTWSIINDQVSSIAEAHAVLYRDVWLLDAGLACSKQVRCNASLYQLNISLKAALPVMTATKQTGIATELRRPC